MIQKLNSMNNINYNKVNHIAERKLNYDIPNPSKLTKNKTTIIPQSYVDL